RGSACRLRYTACNRAVPAKRATSVTSTQLLRRRAATERHRVALPWAPQAHPERARRALNLVIAVAGLLLMTPVLLAIAALIKLTCGGAVVCKHAPIGR